MITRKATSWTGGASARAAIVEAAISAFAAEGYTSTSLDRIARHLGISRQLLLHYFPGKAALLMAVLDQHDARRAPLPPPASPPSESLWEIGRAAFPVEDESELRRLSSRLTSEATGEDHPAHAWAAHRQRRLLAEFESFFAAAGERGTLPPDADASALALIALGALEGIERRRLVDRDPAPQSAISSLRDLVAAVAATDREALAPQRA